MNKPMREMKKHLDLNEWQVAGIQKAVASLEARGFRERVKEWG